MLIMLLLNRRQACLKIQREREIYSNRTLSSYKKPYSIVDVLKCCNYVETQRVAQKSILS